MKRIGLMAMIAAAVWCPVLCAQAQDATGAAKPKGEANRPPATDMTVTGTLSKEMRTNPSGKTTTRYILTEASGARVMVHSGEPHPQGDNANVPPPTPEDNKLEAFLGKHVTITGKGFTADRDGKQVVHIRVVSIDLASAAPAAAAPAKPAAPAGAPAAK